MPAPNATANAAADARVNVAAIKLDSAFKFFPFLSVAVLWLVIRFYLVFLNGLNVFFLWYSVVSYSSL